MCRFAMIVFVMLLGTAGMGWEPARAQDATPAAAEAMATHPVVGLWRFTTDLGGGVTIPSLAMFHADGTYIEDFPDAGTFSMGVWEPTGLRTATFTFYQVYTIDDRVVEGVGRSSAEVDATGTAIFTTGSFVGTFADGTIEIAAEGPAPGVRLGVLPPASLADLVPGGTPVIPENVAGVTTTP